MIFLNPLAPWDTPGTPSSSATLAASQRRVAVTSLWAPARASTCGSAGGGAIFLWENHRKAWKNSGKIMEAPGKLRENNLRMRDSWVNLGEK